MDFPEWDVYDGATFEPGDPQFRRWSARRNGALRHQRLGPHGVHAVDAGAAAARPVLHGAAGALRRLLARATRRGFATDLNCLTWVVLKAPHQEPRRHGDAAQRRSARHAGDRLPLLHRRGRRRSDGGGRRRAVRPRAERSGCRVRRRRGRARCCRADDVAVRCGARATSCASNAWGHHACGTCAIGASASRRRCSTAASASTAPRDLRVVDASVFPRIPGFFIVSAVYMIGEKAADVMLAERVIPA